MNKQTFITMIAGRLENKDCHVVHAEGDADVDVVKAAITMSSFKSITLIGKYFFMLKVSWPLLSLRQKQREIPGVQYKNW